MKNKAKQRWMAVLMALLMVVGMMPADWAASEVNAATAFEGGVAVTDGTWTGWTWSVFGNSTNTDTSSIKESGDGGVQLSQTGNKGKIAGSQEGINFLYYTLDSDCDFILSAQAQVEAWGSGNQHGFGLMARAAVGTHGEPADASPLNSAFVGGTVQSGVSCAGSYRAGSRSNIISPSGENDGIAVGTTYDLTIQKTGDALYLYKNGELVKQGSASEIFTGSDGKMYVGMFVSRTATVTYKNVTLSYEKTADAAAATVGAVTNPAKMTYCQGNSYEDIDLSGFSATVNVAGLDKNITALDCRLVSFDFSTTGDAAGKIVLDYFGHEIVINTNVIKEVVDDITVNYLPVKTDYVLNDTIDSIDWTGFDATVTYNSGVIKKLEDLIAGSDAETTVAFDSSKAGASSIVVEHTHGDVTKQVIIPVTVSDAAVTAITLTGPNQTTFYKDVTVDADAYKKGLLVNAAYSDGSTKVLSTGFTVTPKTTELDVTATGTYTYVVTYGGQTAEYTLEVVDRNVSGLNIKTYPSTTTFVKGTDFSATGLEVEAVYDSGEKTILADGTYTVDSSAYNKDAAGQYTITISATVDGKTLTTTYVAEVRDKTTFGYEDLEWHSIVFGQSIDKNNKPSVTTENGITTITVEQGEGKGKCTDDGQDGIAYYYTILNPQTDNFEITAKVKVDYFITKSAPDNQEGFGIMVRDSIGTDGDASIYYSNAMSVGGYYGRYNVFGRHGVLSQDETTGKVNNTLYGKMGNLSEQIKADSPKTFILTLKKDNTGVYATMKNEDGTIVDGIDNVMYYLPANTFSSIEDEKMYVGFMAARGAKIEIDASSIQMIVTAAAADAPQTFAPAEPVKPSVSLASLPETADESYEFKVSVNTKGLLTIKKDGETIVSQQAVEKGSYSFPTNLTVGANKFQMYLEPDSTQNITSDAPVTVNTTITRKIYSNSETAIYVSTTGTKSGDGSKENPLDIQTALTYCQAGQAIYVLEGTYNLSKTTGVWEGNDGTENALKQLIACPENKGDVIFDFADSKGKATNYTFDFSGDYWYIKGIKFLNGGGVRVGGNHNILELCDFAGHTNSGLSISRTNGATDIADWPSYNQIINCNSYSNRDKSDNNADGFAAKLTCGVGNVFKGCVAAYNADDGWDLFSKGGTGAIGEVKIYDCVCFGNGFAYDAATGTVTATKGDGNGFKMGGSGIAVNHQVYNSYSFGNKANGFTNNSDPMGTYVDCIGYNNGGSNLELHTYTGVEPQFIVTGFKSFADGTYASVAGLSATEKESAANCINSVLAASNFFYDGEKFVNSDGEEITAANFESLAEFAGYVNGGIGSVVRDANGNLVLGGFLKFVENQKPEEPSEEDDSENDSDEAGSVNESVKTGDDTNLGLLFVTGFTSLLVLAYLYFESKKKTLTE